MSNALLFDNELNSIVSEASNVIRALKETKRPDRYDLITRAKKIEQETDSYISKRNGHHALNEEINKVKSRIEINRELLKTTTSNVSFIRSRLHSSNTFENNYKSFDNVRERTRENIDEKLNQVNTKIHEAIRNLSAKTKSGSKLEKLLRKYQEISKETTDLFKKTPNILQSGRLLRDKVQLKQANDADRRAEEMLTKLSSVKIEGTTFEAAAKETKAVDGTERAGLRNWINYEGFDTKEELEKFKSLYKKMTGNDPDDELYDQQENTLEIIEEEPTEKSELDDAEFIQKMFAELMLEDKKNQKYSNTTKIFSS